MNLKEEISFLDLIHETKNFIKYGKEISQKENLIYKTEEKISPFKEEAKVSSLKSENEIDHQDEMELLKMKIENCMLCSLSKSRTHTVFGSGNPKSILYIVGEAPGRDEDLQGQPFVGRGGQLLTKMLEAIAINRDDIFITNIIKCRPPDNRNPEPDEIMRCSPYLEKQIQFGNPSFILALGRFSTGYFLNDFKSSLSELRSQSHQIGNATLLITYHPAAVLRSPNRWKPLVWEDLKKLANLLLEKDYYNEEQKAILKRNKVIE